MVKREIIKIDEELCTGCGDCIPNCPEGALQIIDDKARIISDLFCDGLGACIGHCPVDAISIEEREAEKYDERKVMENVVKQGPNVIKAHLEHLKDHGQDDYLQEAIDYLKENDMEVPLEEPSPEAPPLPCGCPGSAVQDFRDDTTCATPPTSEPVSRAASELRQWPVQIMLVPPSAPYLKDAELMIAADCVPFAYANFHEDFLKDKVLLIGCPKLDDIEYYKNKFQDIFNENEIRSVTYVHMEVPCCTGMVNAINSALEASGKTIPIKEITISVKGEKIDEK
ncbi:MAG: 4Fe-4S binding protein [Thermoplasmata archaeon]|nr:4Fe-4S binding protein [Thermoplasmata archaeon]